MTLAIILVHLEGMEDIPSILDYHRNPSWLAVNLLHFELDFNLNNVDFEATHENIFKFRLNRFRTIFI